MPLQIKRDLIIFKKSYVIFCKNYAYWLYLLKYGLNKHFCFFFIILNFQMLIKWHFNFNTFYINFKMRFRTISTSTFAANYEAILILHVLQTF